MVGVTLPVVEGEIERVNEIEFATCLGQLKYGAAARKVEVLGWSVHVPTMRIGRLPDELKLPAQLSVSPEPLPDEPLLLGLKVYLLRQRERRHWRLLLQLALTCSVFALIPCRRIRFHLPSAFLTPLVIFIVLFVVDIVVAVVMVYSLPTCHGRRSDGIAHDHLPKAQPIDGPKPAVSNARDSRRSW